MNRTVVNNVVQVRRGSGAKLQFLRLKPSRIIQKSHEQAPKYKHFRLKLFEFESLHQNLRSLVLMRVKNWDYRELRERIADGYTLRAFTDFRSQPVPKHDAFHRACNRLTPQTLNVINDFVIRAAVDVGLEDGSKLRVDTTVVQTDIHHPTDNMLSWDTVRGITRLVGRLVGCVASTLFRTNGMFYGFAEVGD